MGAPGVGTFEDETALDWFEGEVEERGAPAVQAALDAVLANPAARALDAEAGIRGRTAAEIVATVFGAPPAGLDTERREAILGAAGALRRDPSAVDRALKVAARVWADSSELHRLWMEVEDTRADWWAAGADLSARLGRVATD